MDPEAARTARESLELVFQMSNILDLGLDRHTLSVLIALCDHGLNPEALAAVVKEFRKEPPLTSSTPTTPSDKRKASEYRRAMKCYCHKADIKIVTNLRTGGFT
ncbi:Protein of unknown function DUF3743 [Cynara cardunculus var. scolymus]|uniref:Mitotic-spindle organizing protein 1 n=1 Tax=Cynara cardunculus var. scolymus TaxID=59895 RepID=A0A103XZP1_CYNCS|nr:Protein of unknown function DUF3743 [Cynara cardunculus var. scolymus]